MFRKKDPEMAARIPPGQHLTRGWPVLAALRSGNVALPLHRLV
jgi:hypothetical protein